MSAISVKDVTDTLEKFSGGLEWAGRRIAGNTYNKVSEELVKMAKELAQAGKIDPKDLLEREFVKIHDGKKYRIKFQKPSRK